MAYATVTDVQAMVPELTLGATSTPTSDQVTTQIARIEAEINGVLRAIGYTTIPVTDSDDSALLAGHVTQKVAAWVYMVAFRGDDEPYKVKRWNDDYTAFLNRLRKGEQQLASADNTPGVRGGTVLPYRYVT